MPPFGNPVGLMVFGAPAVSSAKPRIVVSPPAKKRSLAGRSSIGGSGNAVDTGHGAGKSVREADCDAAGEDDALVHRQAMEPEPLHVRFQEPDLAAERPRCDARLLRNERAPLRIEHVVTRIARNRTGEDGQPHLREQAIDPRLVLGVDLLARNVLVVLNE